MDANFWVLVIGAIFLGLTKLWSMYLDYKREQAKIIRDESTAAEVNAVKKTLQYATQTQSDHAERREKKLDQVAEKVEQVRIESNGMKDALVEEVRKAATLKGRDDERDRADAEKKTGG